MVLAIDAPLAFPRAFRDLLNGADVPPFAPDSPEINNPLAYRQSDRRIFEVFGKKPLSASFDKLGNNATVAMVLARRLARRHGAKVVPFDEVEERAHSIIEVYPALAKVPKDTCCFPPMQRLLPPGVIAGTDESDAAICAVLALAFAARGTYAELPSLGGPDDASLVAAREEGWIYYVERNWLTSERGTGSPG